VNPLVGVQHMLEHGFLRHGLVAGTAIAAAAGLVGYFLVLRSQVFTADALSHVAFTGALAALTVGIDARVGLFVTTTAAGLVLGVLGPRGRADDVTIGSTFAWILGLGVLALSVFASGHSAGHGTAGVSILFGSIYGLDASAAAVAVLVAIAVLGLVAVIARPLLFATLDEAVAAARGVPVRALGILFAVLVGVTTAEATQAVGALLILGLLAGPAGIAMRITARPFRAMALSAGVAIAAVWGGLALSYAAPRLPPSFSIMSAIAVAYVVTTAATAARRGPPRPPRSAPEVRASGRSSPA
jgi:zinc/manganese transport system permease protein